MQVVRWTREQAIEQLRQWVAMGWTLVGMDEAGRG
ncbi:MAG: hypothetical protein SLRJCFUN_000226, partial [Candidatus Fervidibacter sp.]